MKHELSPWGAGGRREPTAEAKINVGSECEAKSQKPKGKRRGGEREGRAWKQAIRRRAELYRRLISHPRTPRLARWLLALAVGYALLPFDLIPDWIPVLGFLDDVLLVPGLVWVAWRLVPQEVRVECEREVFGTERKKGA